MNYTGQEIKDLIGDLHGVGLHTPSVKEMLEFVARTEDDWEYGNVYVATFWGSSEYNIKGLKTPPTELSDYSEAAIEFCRNLGKYRGLLEDLGLRYWTSDTGCIEGDYVVFYLSSAKNEDDE